MQHTKIQNSEQAGQIANETWAYSRDGWEKLETDPTAEFEQGGPSDWHSTLKRAGFAVRCDREAYVDAIAIHEAERPTSMTGQFRFVVDISLDTDSFQAVYVRDLPALVALMPSIMAAKAAIRFDSFSEKLEEIAEKLFRATHGHSHWTACRQCDPLAARQQEEAYAKHQASRGR